MSFLKSLVSPTRYPKLFRLVGWFHRRFSWGSSLGNHATGGVNPNVITMTTQDKHPIHFESDTKMRTCDVEWTVSDQAVSLSWVLPVYNNRGVYTAPLYVKVNKPGKYTVWFYNAPNKNPIHYDGVLTIYCE